MNIEKLVKENIKKIKEHFTTDEENVNDRIIVNIWEKYGYARIYISPLKKHSFGSYIDLKTSKVYSKDENSFEAAEKVLKFISSIEELEKEEEEEVIIEDIVVTDDIDYGAEVQHYEVVKRLVKKSSESLIDKILKEKGLKSSIVNKIEDLGDDIDSDSFKSSFISVSLSDINIPGIPRILGYNSNAIALRVLTDWGSTKKIEKSNFKKIFSEEEISFLEKYIPKKYDTSLQVSKLASIIYKEMIEEGTPRSRKAWGQAMKMAWNLKK